MAGILFKTPPSFTSDVKYESWKKDIQVWCKLTDIPKEKQAVTIHLALTGKARKVSSHLERRELEKSDGVEHLLRKLDQFYYMDESRRQFRAFQELYNLRRSIDGDICEFVNEFERYYKRLKQEKMKLPDTVMAFMLLESCTLSEAQFQFLMSNMPPRRSYENIKASLKRIFMGKLESVMPVDIKLEPEFFSEEPVSPTNVDLQSNDELSEDVYFGNNMNNGDILGLDPRGRSLKFRGCGRGLGKDLLCVKREIYKGGFDQLNPPGPDGEPSECVMCQSKYHWARDCPLLFEKNESCEDSVGLEKSENECWEESVGLGLEKGENERCEDSVGLEKGENERCEDSVEKEVMLNPKLTEVDDCGVEMQSVTEPLSLGPESEGSSSLSSPQEMEDAPALTNLNPVEAEGRVKKGKKKCLSFEQCLLQMTLECEFNMCSAKFRKMEIFCIHINEHLTSDFTVVTEDGYVCVWRDCEYACDTKEELDRHIHFHAFHTKVKAVGTVLANTYGGVVCTLDSNGRNVIPEIPDDFQCMWDSCSDRFASAQEFYWHVQRHVFNLYPNENKQYICCWQGCKWKFKVHLRLSDHVRSHSQEKRVGCPNCGMIYSTNTKFFDHYMRQVPVKLQPHQCSHCSVRFPTVRLLRDHVRRHINHFKCAECDMTCPTRGVLLSHMKYKHNNARPYKCPHCDKSFKSSVDLTRHMTVHSDEPAFLCPLATCEYACRSQSTLNKHIKLHHNSLTKYHYLCHICDSKFSTGFFLTKHLKKIHHFHWPSGHSRFRYKQEPDGFYRLQTIRYESMVLMNEGDENLQDDDVEMVDDPLAVASPQADDKVSQDVSQADQDSKIDIEKSVILSPPSMPRIAKNQQIILPSEF